MRGNASRFPDAQPSMAANRTALLNWLYGAKDEILLAMSVETLAQRHKIHASPRENIRQVETLLLARQAAKRREIEARAMGEPI